MTVVRTTDEADKHIRSIAFWWQANRPAAPELFDHELTAAFRRLAATPESARVYRRTRGREVRRLLLVRTRYHVYYVYSAAQAAVFVVAVWPAMRGSAPRLRLP